MCKKCYVSTPIYYASGNVQIGNSYTTVACDVYARFNRQMGRKTFYLTGMDEHGQKIEEAASKAGKTPKELVDEVAIATKSLWKTMYVDYDYFIRTTDKAHEKIVGEVFEKLLANDDIYLGSYSGNYCVSCETFYTKTQLGENDTCPDCGKPTKLVSEESYFLRLKKYANQLLKYIDQHPDFIQPETRKNEVVSFIESGLEDLCVSRTSFKWGIKVPSNPKHVIYVWIDALFNYLTALGYSTENDELYKEFWLENDNACHVVGKDILRFHAIYWPIMLMALNIPLNFKLYVHGWILTKEGKMSKSRGNAVYPMDLINRYGVDSVRYYLAKELPLGNDGLFSYERFIERYNTELANDLGNLVSRSVSMIDKYFDGNILNPDVPTEFDESLKEVANSSIKKTIEAFDNFQLQDGMISTGQFVRRVNKYIDETAPWALAKDEAKRGMLQTVMYHLAESLRVIAVLVAPYLVETAPKILHAIGQNNEDLRIDKLTFGKNLNGSKTNKVENLFKRLDMALELKYYEELKNKKEESNPSKNDEKVEKIEKITIDDFAKISLKVGEILECKKHPNAEKLLVSQIKIGNETRQIVSGIAKYYQPEELVGKKVIIVANLQPVKIRGVESNGMVLCAAEGEDLELVEVNKLSSGATVR